MDQEFPKFELEQVLHSDAADILAAREKAHIMHHGKDIRAAGNEVEMTFRKVLRRKLASSYYIGHGPIVDQMLHQSPQLDVIITDNTGAPVLFQAEDGSEYFPYEGVYAIGEVKSSYEKGKRYIHTFVDRLADIQTKLLRNAPERRISLRQSFPPTLPQDREGCPFAHFRPVHESGYDNPLFSFLFFADAGDFQLEDVIDLYQTRSSEVFPNIVCFLNRGVIVNGITSINVDKGIPNWPLLTYLTPGVINVMPAYNLEMANDCTGYELEQHWVLLEYGTSTKQVGAHLVTLYSLLATHLRECRLTVPNLVAYYDQLFDQPTETIIV